MYGIIVLGIYALLMIGATILFTKKTRKTDNFHVADRRIGGLIATLSIAATWIWAPALFTSSTQAYNNGVAGLFWFLVPNVLCLIIFIPFAKKMRQEYPTGVTLSGYMGMKYGKQVKGAYQFQLGGLAILSTAVQLLAGSQMLSFITGAPFLLMTILLAVVAFSYSQFSGIKASVTSDVLQIAIILVGCAIIVPFAFKNGGGMSTLLNGLGGATGEFKSLGGKSGLNVFLSFGLPTTIGLLSGPFGDQSFWQRTFSIRKESIGKSYFFGALLFGIVPLSMGMLGYLAAGSGFVAKDSSMVNFEFISSILPKWTFIPFLFMIISGLLSTVDSNLCSAASLTCDLVRKQSREQNIKMSKLVMVVLLVIAIAIANIPGITVTHLFLFYGTLRASTLLPTVITLHGKELNPRGVFVGIVCSLIIGLPVFAYGSLTGIAIYKTIGSLLSVSLSGIIATLSTSKGVNAK